MYVANVCRECVSRMCTSKRLLRDEGRIDVLRGQKKVSE